MSQWVSVLRAVALARGQSAKPRQDGLGLHDLTACSALTWRELLALHCQAAPLFSREVDSPGPGLGGQGLR